jgi:hypothetical protein
MRRKGSALLRARVHMDVPHTDVSNAGTAPQTKRALCVQVLDVASLSRLSLFASVHTTPSASPNAPSPRLSISARHGHCRPAHPCPPLWPVPPHSLFSLPRCRGRCAAERHVPRSAPYRGEACAFALPISARKAYVSPCVVCRRRTPLATDCLEPAMGSCECHDNTRL